MSHPSLEQLLLAQEASRADSEARRHLDDGCRTCASRLERAERILLSLQEGPLPSVPEAWIQRAVAVASPEQPGLLDRARQLLGQLIEDSRQGAPALALRGRGLARTHLLYRAGEYDVDLALLSDGGLVGQVLPAEEHTPELEHATCLLAGPEGPRVVPLGELGDFRFPNVGPGDYALVVESAQAELVIDRIPLSDAHPSGGE